MDWGRDASAGEAGWAATEDRTSAGDCAATDDWPSADECAAAGDRVADWAAPGLREGTGGGLAVMLVMGQVQENVLNLQRITVSPGLDQSGGRV